MSELPYVRLANDIAAQFHHVPATRQRMPSPTHLHMFWDPRMRTQLLAPLAAGGAGS